jgi:hypothetical protein
MVGANIMVSLSRGDDVLLTAFALWSVMPLSVKSTRLSSQVDGGVALSIVCMPVKEDDGWALMGIVKPAAVILKWRLVRADSPIPVTLALWKSEVVEMPWTSEPDMSSWQSHDHTLPR